MILFVDDEKQYIENIITELESLGIEVTFCAGVDEALNRIRSGERSIDAIVCDVMMPHGSAFSAAQTEDNKIAGLVFLADLRQRGVNLPVVLLTNLESGRAPVDETARQYSPCVVIRKRDKWSFEIAEIIGKLLKYGRFQ